MKMLRKIPENTVDPESLKNDSQQQLDKVEEIIEDIQRDRIRE